MKTKTDLQDEMLQKRLLDFLLDAGINTGPITAATAQWASSTMQDPDAGWLKICFTIEQNITIQAYMTFEGELTKIMKGRPQDVEDEGVLRLCSAPWRTRAQALVNTADWLGVTVLPTKL